MAKARRRQDPTQRFWARVNKTDDCWYWMGSCDKDGYGKFPIAGKGWERAHRVAWMLTNGIIPAGLEVCHTCDNASCVRIDHLFVGTQMDNMRDKSKKGRHPGQPKLSAVLVAELRRCRTEDALTMKELGVQFHVSPAQVCRIVNRQNWQGVT